eukprot:CAMPEP_0176146970 /NCGR_PEP_ID=MMETSP0120_2-20121206/74908_1 /TAXON_ID=160619 /ORGANISM="Kryptoperidinium foliaceum, Strain CCMP 1326" /LENGTH=44 /DNA_ID= /DNA_START= /DNA_END= /DNA_ORIENTATION=
MACPMGWQLTGGVCAAPPTYIGSCAFVANTSAMTVEQKKEYGRR